MPNGYHDKSGSSAMAVPRDKDRLTAKGWLNPAALPWALLAHCLLFGLLIVSVQYFWLDGKPYLVLGDDAMIAMRYAWHWAQGFGIYWNTNATPEGYSNFLLVGVMAV
jgi:hypothetical protein